MKPLRAILGTASASDKIIALSEGDDPRVVEGAVRAVKEDVARIILIGDGAKISALLDAHEGFDPTRIDILDPAHSSITTELAEALFNRRKHKGMTLEEAGQQITNRLTFAAMLVHQGIADGTLGGAVETTSDTVRAALQIIGTAPGTTMVSSFFLMLFCQDHHEVKGARIFADCGLVVDPNAEEMAEIARASAASYSALTGNTARVAMLSFSTSGSAEHPKVSKVVEATRIAREKDPNLLIDGELQFDAAFVPEVAAQKATDSPLKGEANVFVFPSLNAGNLGYKIAQRIGGVEAIGPVLQGLAKPANDLSRGCTAEDILHMIAVTAVQAQHGENGI
ncbi:phosphate acetyltransferase [Ruegeria faecimaris]|uniref:Phosphate acetyltransferase n=1 Tax=Ruegeria faecimaris TaxID=686389 RepID=A0A521D9Y3_9RHOB|nr:phosphate acetyltransferase [Ruegeria faecimaris]SMO67901.1 phosphate acetyltransferase [Ruegeria faecimaris]